MTNLIELNLGYNLIKTVYLDVTNMKSIRSLFLENNEIQHLDCGIYPQNLSKNRLEEIDLNCSLRYSNLNLNIDFNHLTVLKLPQSNLTNSINSIFASGNKINQIKIEENMQKLKHLKLVNNSRMNAADIYEKCISLETLDLSNNEIYNFSYHSLDKLDQLRYLYLNNSGLNEIGLGTFSHQQNLKVLDLSNNNLNAINFDVFLPQFNQLTELYLSGNKLKNLNGWRHSIFPRFEFFTISMNDFTCSYLGKFLHDFPKNISLTSNSTISLHEKNRKNIHGISCIDVSLDDDEEERKFTSNQTDSMQTIKNLLIILICGVCVICIAYVGPKIFGKLKYFSLE